MEAEATPASAAEITPTSAREAKAPFREVVLVCAKCARKLDGRGFGKKGRKPLRAELKRALKSGRWGAKVRVVDTACLGLCPKGRQVIATPKGLARRRLTVMAPGAPVETALDRVLTPESEET